MTVRRPRLALAALLAAALWSCTDLDMKPLPTVGSSDSDPAIANPSLAADIQPIFTARCAVVGCHITPTEANLGLVLTDPATSYSNLVGISSVEFPGVFRVQAGASDQSYIMFKLDFGDMPKEGPMLSQGTRDTIRNWIDQGAQNN
jgi:hypothetical protein